MRAVDGGFWKRWIPLLLITAAGGVLRFACLDRPEIWGDEAATFHRVSGSYAEMLEVLRLDGFVPLHYEMYWVLGRWFRLTPAMMRVVPALAGTLMVPAVYFLARQLVSRRAALLAAAFTACSAWLMVYSHDAKMYMHFWLFVTLHVACLLWWMRTGMRVALWGTVAAGLAMCGLHATGLLVLLLDVLFFLAHPRTTWKRSVWFALAMAVIVAGPAGYYLGFNRFSDKVEAQGWRSTGIGWVEQRNEGVTTDLLVSDTAAAYLFGFNFVPERFRGMEPPKPTPRVITVTAWAVLGSLVLFAVLGALPWRRRGEADDGKADGTPLPLTLFYLGTWLALPTYIFYCASVEGFSSPVAVLPWYAWGVLAVFLGVAVVLFRPARVAGWRVIVPLSLPVLLCFVVYLAMRGRTPPGSIWMPRYLGIVFPAMAVALCALYVRLPRGLMYPAIGLLLGVNVVQSVARLYAHTEPPVSVVAKDVWEARDPGGESRTYVEVRGPFGWAPGTGNVTGVVGLYHLRLLSGHALRPVQFRTVTGDVVTPIRRFTGTGTIARDLKANPQVRELTLWTLMDAGDPEPEVGLTEALGDGWQLASVKDYPARVFWTWSPSYTYRRLSFRRDGEVSR